MMRDGHRLIIQLYSGRRPSTFYSPPEIRSAPARAPLGPRPIFNSPALVVFRPPSGDRAATGRRPSVDRSSAFHLAGFDFFLTKSLGGDHSISSVPDRCPTGDRAGAGRVVGGEWKSSGRRQNFNCALKLQRRPSDALKTSGHRAIAARRPVEIG